MLIIVYNKLNLKKRRVNMKCSNQSFHLPTSYKGKCFVACNYYGLIVDTKRCEKCDIKKIKEREYKNNE